MIQHELERLASFTPDLVGLGDGGESIAPLAASEFASDTMSRSLAQESGYADQDRDRQYV
jgi:hypothetical protein